MSTETWARCALRCGYALIILALMLVGCEAAPAGQPAIIVPAEQRTTTPEPEQNKERAITDPVTATSTPPPPLGGTPAMTPVPTLVPTLLPTADVTPGPAGTCGLLLPAVSNPVEPAVTALNGNVSLTAVPEAVRPAVREMLDHPGRVSLVTYRVGEEADGLYLNADTPRPLASVVKIVHLVAYAQAVYAGELDPNTPVLLSELDRFYLPNSDLRAHPNALAALTEEGLVTGNPPALPLETVPRMMIQYSSNAATDYLHLLLGQQRLEQTVRDLGLAGHTAPCPFLGQFILMNNPERTVSGRTAVEQYRQDPRLFGVEVMDMTYRYAYDSAFREEVGGWRGRANRPGIDTQRLFSAELNTMGSAQAYADLMARIAMNELGPWEMNVLVRRYLEWPTFFDANQEQMAWTGYKGGSLPGILTVAYYAQPWWRTQPAVVALFFQDLPQSTYRAWRDDLPHDELARWLLREPDALPLLKSILQADGP
jgi:hypothetical protein